MPERGVVIGKFHPPHRGHKHLVDVARAAVDHLTVILCGRPGELPEPALRAAWLREIHPGVEVLVVEDRFDPADSRLWAELSVGWLRGRPDVAFTSEEYGARWAAFMGCTHVAVDPERRRFPVSGTAVRADPLGNWVHLEPCVRAYYARRVVVVGAESSGTTTIARELAARFRTTWVTEYGREYYEARVHRGLASGWRTEEFVHIATEQCRREDRAAREANRLLVCDTDAFATAIWHERYLGTASPKVAALAAGRACDLYLLTAPDFPFVQDGYRDGEHIRQWMHGRFQAELEARGAEFVVLSGPHEERMQAAVAAIESRWPQLGAQPGST